MRLILMSGFVGLILAAGGCAANQPEPKPTSQVATTDLNERINCKCGSWSFSKGPPPPCKAKALAQAQARRQMAAHLTTAPSM